MKQKWYFGNFKALSQMVTRFYYFSLLEPSLNKSGLDCCTMRNNLLIHPNIFIDNQFPDMFVRPSLPNRLQPSWPSDIWASSAKDSQAWPRYLQNYSAYPKTCEQKQMLIVSRAQIYSSLLIAMTFETIGLRNIHVHHKRMFM